MTSGMKQNDQRWSMQDTATASARGNNLCEFRPTDLIPNCDLLVLVKTKAWAKKTTGPNREIRTRRWCRTKDDAGLRAQPRPKQEPSPKRKPRPNGTWPARGSLRAVKDRPRCPRMAICHTFPGLPTPHTQESCFRPQFPREMRHQPLESPTIRTLPRL